MDPFHDPRHLMTSKSSVDKGIPKKRGNLFLTVQLQDNTYKTRKVF